MSLRPQPIGPLPEVTAYVARAFPGGDPCLAVRDGLGNFDDDRFDALFPDLGRPAEDPWRLVPVG